MCQEATDGLHALHRAPCDDAPLPLLPLPPRQVGVGAFVLNDRREVLVVQERSGPLRGKGVWKMPTGLVQVGFGLHPCRCRNQGLVAHVLDTRVAVSTGMPDSVC